MSKGRTLSLLSEKGFPVPESKSYSLEKSAELIAADIRNQFPKVELFAVRSSAAVEDGKEKSFAGQFTSRVAVTPVELEKEIGVVKDSMPGDANDEILLQPFIQGEYSGVLFFDGSKDIAYIEALSGLCKPVVEGADCQQWKCEGQHCVMTRQPEKLNGLFFDGEKLVSRRVPPIPADFQFEELLSFAKSMEKHLGVGLDIEWTFVEGNFVILQARPISRSLWDIKTSYALFDSANVGESYSGMVSPLTMGFARKLYEIVYRDLMTHSAAPVQKVEKYRAYFEELVDGAYGRMYYRMENWYRMMAFLPGYRRNKKNLENMLQLNISEEIDTDYLHPSLWHQLVYYPLALVKFVQLSGKLERLAGEVRLVLKNHRARDLKDWDAEQCRKAIDLLFDGVLRKWYLTVENDTVMMTLFAHIKKRGDHSMQRAMGFHSEATEQINALVDLSRLMLSDPVAKNCIEKKDRRGFYQTLNTRTDLKASWDNYRERFGGRFANELKLETPSFDEDFEKVCQAIKHFSNLFKITDRKTSKANGWMERNFQKFAARRERFRLLRANLFDVVRQLVFRLGEVYTKKGWLNEPGDIFFLDWEEAVKGENHHQWKSAVAQRKLEYSYFESIRPPAFFKVVSGKWPNLEEQQDASPSLEGMVASQGVVTGKVRVIEDFEMPEEIDFDILVTRRTDPGWTPLIALSKGLIVEHGGILSHAAIVARELDKPTLIGVKGVCNSLKTGDVVRLDARTGLVVKLSSVNE